MKRVSRFLFCAPAFVLFQIATAPNAYAVPIVGPNLATFAILGGAGVALNGTGSVITGSVGGCCVATAVTGVIPTNFNISGGTVQQGGGTAIAAQGELGTAMTALNGATVNFSGLSTLGAPGAGQNLAPGVYAAPSGLDLTGTLNLVGGGDPNALWVFLVTSSLTTAASSVVNLVGTGTGAGVYWVMGASATLGTNSTFVGNLFASTSITVAPNVTATCARLATQTASVTLAGFDTIGSATCNGFSGGEIATGGEGGGVVPGGGGVPAPDQVIPEPATLTLLATGLFGLARWKRRQSGSGRP